MAKKKNPFNVENASEPIITNNDLKNPFQQNNTEIPKTPEAKLTSPEVFKSGDTGKLSGISLPDGRTFLGINQNEVQALAAKQQQKAGMPEGTQPAGTAQNALDTQVRNAQLLEMAQKGLLTTEELQAVTGAKLDIGQALGAGATTAVPGILGGIATGAAAGAGIGALGAGVGAIPGAIIGAGIGGIGAFLVGIRGNIKSQQTGEFAAEQTALTKGQTMLRSLITDTNKNPQNAADNIALFYQTLNMIDAAHAKTWRDSQENLNKFLGNDGTAQLAKFETFDLAMRQYYVNAFQTALAQPNPNQMLLTDEDLNFEFSEE